MGRTFKFQLLATGEIESFKIGKRRKIARDALSAYIDRLRQEQAIPGGDGPGTRPRPSSQLREGQR